MNIIYVCMTVFVLSFLTVYSLTPVIMNFALKVNFVDNPNERKIHKKAIPLLGGVAVFLGFILLFLYLIITKQRAIDLPLLGYLAGAIIIVLVGVIDDRRGMIPIVKLLGQLAACLAFVSTHDLFNLFGPFYITLPLIIVWMVGLMNALNFLDNMDGIITGMSGILALGFYAIGFLSKTPLLAHQADFISLLSLIFAGSVFGFLPYNFNPAKIFLGDAGSMFIGYFLSTMGILAGQLASDSLGGNKLFFLLPVLLLSYAIFDISLVSYTRKRDGRLVSQGGKDHSTHRIGTAMGSEKITAIMVYLINIILVLSTIIVYKMQNNQLLIISVIILASFFIFFGRKLDEVPIIIPENQIKKEK